MSRMHDRPKVKTARSMKWSLTSHDVPTYDNDEWVGAIGKIEQEHALAIGVLVVSAG